MLLYHIDILCLWLATYLYNVQYGIVYYSFIMLLPVINAMKDIFHLVICHVGMWFNAKLHIS